jgi:lipopolysaccharide transport system ATP-binding protein
MHARLGFAIAAHLDPDVLLIDEVLTVGDAGFQQQAFDRIVEMVAGGVPVVVVSHQLDAIARLCTHALLLDAGRVVRAGTPQECIGAYLHGAGSDVGRGAASSGDASAGAGAVRIEALTVAGDVVPSGSRVGGTLSCAVRESGWIDPESVALRIRSAQTGETLFETSTLHLGVGLPNEGVFTVELDLQLNVPPGHYLVESFVWDRIMERESFTGPATHLEVLGGTEFRGSVQMNPQIRLAAGARPLVVQRGIE